MDRNKQLDKIRGSMVGGAVGDALGYPVEFSVRTRAYRKGMARMASHGWIPPSGGCQMKKRAARHGFLTILR